MAIDSEKSNNRGYMHKPLLHSGFETWAPSGMTFVQSGPWKHHLLVATLRGEQLLKIRLKGTNND